MNLRLSVRFVSRFLVTIAAGLGLLLVHRSVPAAALIEEGLRGGDTHIGACFQVDLIALIPVAGAGILHQPALIQALPWDNLGAIWNGEILEEPQSVGAGWFSGGAFSIHFRFYHRQG